MGCMISTIPGYAYQELLRGDKAMLPYFAQWNRIHLDREDLVVSWSEADMSAAFWVFRKPWPRNFAAQWCPELASVSLVCPAVTATMMGCKSACGILQHAHRRLGFAQSPAGADLPADSEVHRERALPQVASGQRKSLVTIYLDGTSLAALAAVHRQAVDRTVSPEMAARQAIWSRWGNSITPRGCPPNRRMGLQSCWNTG